MRYIIYMYIYTERPFCQPFIVGARARIITSFGPYSPDLSSHARHLEIVAETPPWHRIIRKAVPSLDPLWYPLRPLFPVRSSVRPFRCLWLRGYAHSAAERKLEESPLFLDPPLRWKLPRWNFEDFGVFEEFWNVHLSVNDRCVKDEIRIYFVKVRRDLIRRI